MMAIRRHRRTAAVVLGVVLLALVAFLAVRHGWRDALPPDWRTAESVPLGAVVKGGVWRGVALAAGAVALLLATARWWARPWAVWAPGAPVRVASKRFVVVVLALMAVGAALRVPRMTLSVYNDEAYALRRQISGMVPLKHLGDPAKFRSVTWEETFYDNRAANNSALFSALSRTSLDAWRAWSDAPRHVISEWAFRVPALVGGVLSIGALAVLALRLAGPSAGACAAALAALHPWHVRYSAEGRCYGLLFLLLPLLLLALHGALTRGRWHRWAAVGLLQYLCMVCYMGIAHLLVALNGAVAVLAFLAWRRREPQPLRALVPLVVCGTAAGALYAALHLPLVLQASKAMASDFYPKGALGGTWFADAASFLALGVTVSSTQHATAAAGLWPWTAVPVAAAAVFVALGGVGAWRLIRGSSAGLVAVASALGGAALTLGFSMAKGIYLMVWYGVFLLPAVLLAVAVGLSALVGNGTPRRLWAAATCICAVLAMVWVPAVAMYWHHGREDMRAIAEEARGARYPDSLANPADSLLLCLWSEVSIYDPAVLTAFDDSALPPLIERAMAEGRSLYVTVSAIERARQSHPETLRRLEEGTDFERIAWRLSTDDTGSAHHLFRLKDRPQR